MIAWRFDQGRLDYFQFDEIKQMAAALVLVDGILKPKTTEDHLRNALAKHSARPFSAPKSHTVWRNYKRVFGCTLLAAEVAGRIVCTELCKQLARHPDEFDVDDYMGNFVTNFYYPSPIFEGYNHRAAQVFPAVAIIKLLISRYLLGEKSSVRLEDIAKYLIANNVSGLEEISFYANLRPKTRVVDLRQLRELVKFISQLSFLKWDNPTLFLEVESREEAMQILTLLAPRRHPRSADEGTEVLNLGARFHGTDLGDLTARKINTFDAEFTEGNKIRVTHLRTERSVKLKQLYFSQQTKPHICDMCTMDTIKQYPWTGRLIEIHHLLPLSSPVRVGASKTSTKDIVGLCPSCHRATHKYYGGWLKSRKVKDFESYDEARHVYAEARQKIVLVR